MSVWYDRDLIEERDSKNKLHNAVIKWWQVKYADKSEQESIPVDDVEASDASEDDDESMKLAAEVYARLNAEKEADDAVLQAQINQAFEQAAAAEAARSQEANFNATTGAYSGAYGMNTVLDKDGQNRVDSIMGEKDAALRMIIEDAQN